MDTDGHINRHANLQTFLLCVQSDVKLRGILVVIRQRHEDAFALFFGGNVNSMFAVTVRLGRYGKSFGTIRMLAVIIFARLAAQITV